jgi:hypothetical protein
MCPVCVSTMAMIAASLGSTGGLAAIAIRKFGVQQGAGKTSEQSTSKEDRNG